MLFAEHVHVHACVCACARVVRCAALWVRVCVQLDVSGLVDMTKPSKRAVAAALRNTKMADQLREVAMASGGCESIDFCVEVRR
jgi:hypothetical protein